MKLGETLAPQGARGDISWPLRRAADLFAEATAVVDGKRTVTYAQLQLRTWWLAAALDAAGVPSGGRVGFLGLNSLAHMECFLGVPAAGRVLVDLNFRLAESELAYIVDDCEIELLIVDDARLDSGRALMARCPSLRMVVLDGDGPADGCESYEQLLRQTPVQPAPVWTDAPATISYTGGTTGVPKGVILSHGNLLANASHNLIATGHAHEDRWLHVCAMFHVAGTSNVLACTSVGARQVIVPRFDAATVIETIRRERITHVALVPTMLAMLLDELQRRSDSALPSLRHIQYAGSPIVPSVQRRLLDHFDCELVQFYGMTEGAPTVTQLPGSDHARGRRGEEPHATRLGGIGTPVIGVQAEVRGPDGTPIASGEVGELWVRGPNVMLGYWNRPDATAAALHDGWYRSGDAARVDADGYLYVVDRVKDMIITGGENVYPAEVEAALHEHPAVGEAAVFAIPDARWGEAVHAVVVPAAGRAVTVDELVEHCRGLIAGYKLPRSIELRSEPLPHSGAGKVLKRELRERYWTGHERRVQ